MVRGRPTAALALSCWLYGLVALAEPGAENASGKSSKAPLPADAATEARLTFEEGVKLIQQSDWAGAEPLLRRSAELLPRASSLYDLGLCLFKLGRFEEAVAIPYQWAKEAYIKSKNVKGVGQFWNAGTWDYAFTSLE